MDDIEQVEYAKLSPKEERIDLDIEDIKYRVKGKREVHTERGEKLEQLKADIKTSAPYRAAEKTAPQVKETAKPGSVSLQKYLAWKKAQQEKRAAVQAPQVKVVYRNAPKAPKRRIVYRDGGAQLQNAQPQGSGVPDISGGMKPPDITGGGAGVYAPRIISDQKIPSIIGDSNIGSGIINSSQPSGSMFDKMGGGGARNTFDNMSGNNPGGSTFDKLGLGASKGGGILGSLGIKKKGGFW